MYDTPEERDKWRARCEEKGTAWAKGVLPNMNPGIQVHIREWLEEENEKHARAVLDAAEESAKVAKEAAVASRDSARWTMIAAMVAFMGVLVQACSG